MKPMIVLGLGLAAIGATTVAVRRAFRPYPIPQAPGSILDVDGERIHVVDVGNGPPIVLLHGFAGNTISWRKVIQPLAGDRRVLALDFPGFGFSDRDPNLNYSHAAHAHRVIRLMDELGISKATLIGHSMGGGIAQRVAESHPERVDKLVLVASVNAADDMAERRRGGQRLLPVMRTAQRSPWLMFKAGRMGLSRTVKDGGLVDREMVEGYIGPLLIPGTVEAVFSMARSSGDDRPVDLAAIRVPTLVVTGDSDPVVPPKVAASLHAGITGSELVVIEDCGHLIAEERPEEFLSALLGFLDPVAEG